MAQTFKRSVKFMKAKQRGKSFKRRQLIRGPTVSILIQRGEVMHALTFWKRAVQPRTGDDEPTRSSLAGRRARRRSLIALSLGGAVVAATAIAFGLPTA